MRSTLRTLRSSTFLLLLACVALPACTIDEDPGDDTLDATGTPDGSSGPPPATPAEFSSALADALCAVNARCDLGLFPADTARCLEAQGQLIGVVPSSTGAVQLDAAQAQTCLQAIDTLACAEADRLLYDDLGIMQRICPAAIVGTVAEGEPCYEPHECAEGLYCERGGNEIEPGSCPGTCTAIPGRPCPGDADAGEPEPTVFCAEDEYCVEETATCVPRGGAGASCRPDYNDCAEGFYCATDGTCTPSPEAGEACGQMGDRYVTCAQHLHCVDDVCQLAIWGQGLGEACDGPLTNCGNGLFCSRGIDSPDGTCEAVAELGEPCGDGTGPGGAWRPCAADLFCDRPAETTTGTCAALLAPGSACTWGSSCRGGTCEDGVCVTGPSCSRP